MSGRKTSAKMDRYMRLSSRLGLRGIIVLIAAMIINICFMNSIRVNAKTGINDNEISAEKADATGGHKITFYAGDGGVLPNERIVFAQNGQNRDTDDGSDYKSKQVFTETGSKFMLGLNPKYENAEKAFLGWSPDAAGSQVYSVLYNYTISDDIDFYAVWGEGSTITFDANGGSIIPDSNDPFPGDKGKTEIKRCYADKTVLGRYVSRKDDVYIEAFPTAQINDETKEFAGWSLSADGNEASTLSNYTVSQDVTLYAVYKDVEESEDDEDEMVTVRLVTREGWLRISGNDDENEKVSEVVVHIKKGSRIPGIGGQIAKGSSGYSLFDTRVDIISEKGDRKCVGWSRTEDGDVSGPRFIGNGGVTDTISSSMVHVIDSDMVLYAVWSDFVTVTLDLNGGNPTERLTEAMFEKGEKGSFSGYSITGLMESSPTRDGYAFSGWTLVKDDPETMLTNKVVTLEKDTTIYAYWKPTIKVTYDANGGYFSDTGEESLVESYLDGDKIVYEDEEETPVINDDHKIFAGWSLTKGGAVENEIIAHGTEMTVYAVWGDAYKVTFDANEVGYFTTSSASDVKEMTVDFKGAAGESITKIIHNAEGRKGKKNNVPVPATDDKNYIFDDTWVIYRIGENGEEVLLTQEPLDRNGVMQYKPESDVTVIPVWKPAVTVTIDYNGKTDSEGNEKTEVKVMKGGLFKTYEEEYYEEVHFFHSVSYDKDSDEEEIKEDDKYYLSSGDCFLSYDNDYICRQLSYEKNGTPINIDEFNEKEINEDICLYALWEKTYTITIDSTGSEQYLNALDESTRKYIDNDFSKKLYAAKGETCNSALLRGGMISKKYLNKINTRTDIPYYFAGFSTVKGSETNTDSAIVEGDTVLYPVWADKYVITIDESEHELAPGHNKFYSAGGCLSEIFDEYYWDDDYWDELNVRDQGFISKDGKYYIDGLSIAKGDAPLDLADTEIESDMTLYPVWKPVVKVTFHAGEYQGIRFINKGYMLSVDSGYADDSYWSYLCYLGETFPNMVIAECAENEEKGFAGWSLEPDGEIIDFRNYKFEKDTDLYAVWSDDCSKVKFKLGVGASYPVNDWDYEWSIGLTHNTYITIDEDSYYDNISFLISNGSNLSDYFKMFDGIKMASGLPLEGYYDEQDDTVLIDTDNYIVTKDVTICARFTKRKEIEVSEADMVVPKTETEMEKKADDISKKAIDRMNENENIDKDEIKAVSDFRPAGDSSIVIKAVRAVKDENALSSLKDVVLGIISDAAKENTTVQALELFDLDATGSGKISIYVGKEFVGFNTIVGHYHNGVWTTQKCIIDRNGYIHPEFNSFSPISISILTEKGETGSESDNDKEKDKDGDVNSSISENSIEKDDNNETDKNSVSENNAETDKNSVSENNAETDDKSDTFSCRLPPYAFTVVFPN